jgi:uncharacterized protein
MPRVIHFEIPADDPERSVEFYSSVFGWTFHKWDGPQPYWLIGTGEGVGINGGLMQKNAPEHPVTNVIDVPSVDDYAVKVEEAGGMIVVPKMPIPGIGYLAYFKDLSGNILGIMQEDSGAA